MVDFTKLPRRSTSVGSSDPREIFRSLPHPSGVNDLYDSQGEVLRTWSDRRSERDLILKLPTGGGKTLVGLLIARASINELHRPALVLAPTRQLVEQIVAEGAKHNIDAEAYLGGAGHPLPARFLSGEAIGVATYKALFNGRSKFGTTSSASNAVQLGTLILDDAHASFDVVRDAFSLTIESADQNSTYAELCSIFRGVFNATGRQGTFDDVVSGSDSAVLEVPHWDWLDRTNQVLELLRKVPEVVRSITWPVLRDELPYSHALVTRRGFSITPLTPPVHKIPSFAECNRRLYMSATIADDSEIIRAFGATAECVSNPIAPVTLAGVAERMILVPGWMQLDRNIAPKALLDALIAFSRDNALNILILTPSFQKANAWAGMATVATDSSSAEASILRMQRREKVGVVVLANRYDGIDLPGDACRVLVLDGLPRGLSDYDMYRASALAGSIVNSTLAQRVEQGIGRAARGASDYCVVVLSGADLVSWLGQAGSMQFLTAATHRQIEIGRTLSQNIHSEKSFVQTAQQCIQRDQAWKRYHAEELADAAQPSSPDTVRIAMAVAEHNAIDKMRQGQPEKAAGILQEAADAAPDDFVKGWLLQLRSRALHLCNETSDAATVQAAAFARNRRLTRPITKLLYKSAPRPDEQAVAVASKLRGFDIPRACLADFDMKMASLTPAASANQFEESLRALGEYLGFLAERPENDYGDGPDVLWRTNHSFDFIFEAKSRKKDHAKPLSKEEHGQLLVAAKWFEANYPAREFVRVSVHPNHLATGNANAQGSKALTLGALSAMVSEVRMLLSDICAGEPEQFGTICANGLMRRKLTPQFIVDRMKNFEVKRG